MKYSDEIMKNNNEMNGMKYSYETNFLVFRSDIERNIDFKNLSNQLVAKALMSRTFVVIFPPLTTTRTDTRPQQNEEILSHTALKSL